MTRLMSLLVLVLCTACSTAIAGTAAPEKVIGVTQRATVGGALDVTPLVLLDPAPVYEDGDEPDEGTRLVAVRYKVTNRGSEDRMIGPTGTIHFHGSDGNDYDVSFLETTAGTKFDQLILAPEQSMVGYHMAEIPEGVTVEEVDFVAGYVNDKQTLRWKAAGLAVTEAPAPPAREDGGPATYRLGEANEITSKRLDDGAQMRISVAATKVTDPAEPAGEVRVGRDRRLVGVEFAVRNVGDNPYADNADDEDPGIFAVHNAADEFVMSHVYGTFVRDGLPLAPGAEDVWTVLFEVPEDFDVDRVSFSPTIGDLAVTLWTLTG
jgi:hypothetical protein